MSAFWVMIIFWLGVVLGFGVFALMQVARDAGDKAQFEMDALSQAFHPKRRDRRSAAPEISATSPNWPRRTDIRPAT